MNTYHTMNHLHSILHNASTHAIAREAPSFFIRNSKLDISSLLKYLLCRTGKTTSNEIMRYFSAFDALDSSVSKQALFQAREKLNPDVFPYINEQIMKYYYQNMNTQTIKGYTVVAIDGSVSEAPYTRECVESFGVGGQKHKRCDKTLPRISGMYDVLNKVFIDTTIGHYQTSEIPMAHAQIFRMQKNYSDKKLLYLADRYYSATDIFLYLDMHNTSYCFRGKKNFYKKQVATIEKDGVIKVPLTTKWIERFKIEEVKDNARKHPKIEIRVIKFKKSEVKELMENEKDEELLLFTNLKENWTREEVIELYGRRWGIETGYGVLKTKLEIERVTSEKPKLILQEMYAQVVVHNIVAIAKQEAEIGIWNTKKHKYQININNLIELIRANLPKLLNIKTKMREIIESIVKRAQKNKEPIRPNRLFKRWDVYIQKPTSLKFRVDGKRNPRVYQTKNRYIRINH